MPPPSRTRPTRPRRVSLYFRFAATLLAALLQQRTAFAQDAAPAPQPPAPAPDTAGPPAPVPAAQPPAGFEPGSPAVRPAGPMFPAQQMEAPRRRRRSTAMMVTGIVSTALGAVALGVGAGLFTNAEQEQLCATDASTGHGELNLMKEPGCGGRETQSTAGIGMMIGGGAAIALGVPLLVVGARSVPVETKVGLGSASMRFRF